MIRNLKTYPAIAAAEAGWSPEQKARQVDELAEYAESLRMR